MGTDLVVTHPCPRCNGVDKLTCPRCDGSGRVGSRTREEQVEAFLREERQVQAALVTRLGGDVDQGIDMQVPTVRCPGCGYTWRLEVGSTCPNCNGDLGAAAARVVAGPTKVYTAKNRSGMKASDVQITMMGSPDAVGFPMDAAESLRSRLRS